MRLSIVLIGFLVAAFCFAGENKAPSSSQKPEAKEQKEEVYIPKDLEDCFRELDKRLRPEDIEKIRKGEITLIDMHFGLGMGLRNGWGLWGGSRLAKYFNELGIFHPDDMSGIILDSYVHYLRKEPLGVDEQIARYKKFWEEQKKAEEEEKKRENEEKKG